MIRLLMITGLLLSKGFYFRPPLLCSSFLARTSRCLNTFNMDEFIEIKEGSASMLYNKKEEVFYNKVQVFNRDTSIQVIKEFSRLRELEWKQKNNDSIEFQGISILDALAATGLRSIRYLKEVPGVKSLTINDILPAATEAAIANCERNNVDMTKVLINSGDAVELMYGHKDSTKQYDVIDLDPYGTAVPFLDAAVHAVSDGGLLCVTCTDMPVLSGNYPEVCFYKYGCVPLKNSFCHEMSLRMLLHAIDSTANKYQRYIVPWMSLSVDFYVRVFVRVFESPAEVKRSLLKKGMMFQSTQCPTFHIQPMGYMERGKKSKSQGSDGKVEKVPPTNNGMKFVPSFLSVPSSCEECGSNMRMGGPIWIAPIHCKEVVDNILTSLKQYSNLRSKDDASADDGVSSSMDNSQYCPATLTRIKAVLTNIAEELPDVPFYYILSDLCSFLRCEMIPLATFQSALVNAGYRVSRFHREPHSIKTDAPNYVIWDILRKHCQVQPPQGSKHRTAMNAAKRILEKEIKTNVDFTPSVKKTSKEAKFLPNPERFWGPKARAGKKKAVDEQNDADDDNNNEGSSSLDHHDHDDNHNDDGVMVIDEKEKACNVHDHVNHHVNQDKEQAEVGPEFKKMKK